MPILVNMVSQMLNWPWFPDAIDLGHSGHLICFFHMVLPGHRHIWQKFLDIPDMYFYACAGQIILGKNNPWQKTPHGLLGRLSLTANNVPNPNVVLVLSNPFTHSLSEFRVFHSVMNSWCRQTEWCHAAYLSVKVSKFRFSVWEKGLMFPSIPCSRPCFGCLWTDLLWVNLWYICFNFFVGTFKKQSWVMTWLICLEQASKLLIAQTTLMRLIHVSASTKVMAMENWVRKKGRKHFWPGKNSE